MPDHDDLDLLIRGNPAYRDVDAIGRAPTSSSPVGRQTRRPRIAEIPRRRDRPLAWRLLGLPSPRELVRALIIDGYPTSTHRWAFGRVSSAVGWTCAAAGVLAAAAGSWLIRAIGLDANVITPALLVLGILALGVAAIRLLPILQALRYAARWQRAMNNAPRR